MTLQLYVLRQLLVSFAVSMGGIALIVLPSVAVQAVGKLEGVGPATIAEYLPLVLIDLVPYLVPMSFLLAVVATFGRLAADRELVAMHNTGRHPLRLLVPGIVMGALLSAGTYWVLAEVSPEWKYARSDFAKRARERALQALGRGVTEIELDDFYLKAESQDPDDPGTFHHVILSLPRGEDQQVTVFADRLRLRFEQEIAVLSFAGFQVFQEDYELFNQSPEWRLDMDELFPHAPRNPNRAKYMASSRIARELAAEAPSFSEVGRHELRFELHQRRAFSITYLLFLLLGMPTGVLLRSGTQLSAFGSAVGYAFLYYLLALRLGKELATAGALPAWIAAWSTNALFLAFGCHLLRKAMWR